MCSDKSAAFFSCLRNNNPVWKSSYNLVSLRKEVWFCFRTKCKRWDKSSSTCHNLFKKLEILFWIIKIKGISEHANSISSICKSLFMCNAIDTVCSATHYAYTSRYKPRYDTLQCTMSIGSWFSWSYYGEREFCILQLSSNIQYIWKSLKSGKSCRIIICTIQYDMNVVFSQRIFNLFCTNIF